MSSLSLGPLFLLLLCSQYGGNALPTDDNGYPITESASTTTEPNPQTIQDNVCCTSRGGLKTAFKGACTRSTCNQFAGKYGATSIQNFVDHCYNEDNQSMLAREVLQCLGKSILQDDFTRLAYQSKNVTQSVFDRVHQIALSVLCAARAKTSACAHLHTLIPDGLGERNIYNVTLFDQNITISTREMFHQCLAPRRDSAEWDNGFASCAYSRNSELYVQPNAPSQVGESCGECKLNLDQASVPFCPNHFSTTTQRRYGTACSSEANAETADNIARSLHTTWAGNGSATLPHGITVDIVNENCSNLLRHVACMSTMGSCESANSRPEWCRASCEDAFEILCNIPDANHVCISLGFASTESTCSNIDPTTILPPSEYQVLPSNDESVRLVDMSLCLKLPSLSGNDEVKDHIASTVLAFTTFLNTDCQTSNCAGSMGYEKVTIDSQCDYNFTFNVALNPTLPAEFVREIFTAKFPSLASRITLVSELSTRRVLFTSNQNARSDAAVGSSASVPVLSVTLVVLSAIAFTLEMATLNC